MKLNSDKIKEISSGAVRVEEENGKIGLYRFTKEQEELYKVTNQDFYEKTFCTSGIKLLFRTDSKKLFLKLTISKGSSRKYFSVDVAVDGKVIGHIDNLDGFSLPLEDVFCEYPQGEFLKEFQLGENTKTVCVHLPWSVKAEIDEISVDDGAFVEGIKRENILLAYGDSITHGYDAVRPSNRYIAKLADALDAAEFNKAIGGEIFFPELAKLKDSFSPDYITVAYGTNDWNTIDENAFKENCKAFYENLRKNYPKSKIFAITPIWRKDMHEQRKFGDFVKVEADIKDAVKELENVTVISGFDFLPQDERFYADKKLHPNDEGFEHYFKALYDKIAK